MRMRLFRALCLMLALCLLCSGALAEAVVQAVPGRLLLAEDEEGGMIENLNTMPDAMFVLGGTLYAQTWSTIYRAVEGGWEQFNLTTEDATGVELSAAGEDGLYLLLRSYTTYDEATGALVSPESMFALWLLPMEEDGSIGEARLMSGISWDVDEENWPQIYNMVIADGAAYILLHDDDTEWELRDIYRVDLATGEGKLVMSDYLSGMTRYKDGLLLARRFNWDGAYDERGQLVKLPEIVSIDPASGETAVLGTMPDTSYGGLAYDAAADAIYYAGSSFVYRCNGGAGDEPVGYLMGSNSSRSEMAAVIWNERYYSSDWRDESYVSSATLDPSLLPTRTLRLGDTWYAEDIIRQFAKENPDVAVEYVDVPASSAEEYRSHMESPQAADIYCLSLPYSPYAPLLKYGLLADLSGSDKLADTVGRMYPNMTSAYLADGKLYGLPISIYATTLGYYPDALEKVGMTEDDLPATYDELLDFVADWYYDYYDDYEEMQLFEWSPELRMSFFQMIFMAQVMSCEAKGESVTFRTPAVLRLLNRLDSQEMKTVFDALHPEQSSGIVGGLVVYESFYDGSATAVFTSSHDPLPSMYSRWMNSEPLMLRLDEDSAPAISANVTLMTVNRASKNQDLAIELLEYIAERLPQDLTTTMMPDVNEPIQVSYYEENLASYREVLDMLTKEAEEAPEEEKGFYEETIQWYQDMMVRMEEDRWAFSEEDIAYYREHIAPCLVVSASSIFNGEDNPATTAMQLYIDGARNAEFFLSEIDRIVTMMQEESR